MLSHAFGSQSFKGIITWHTLLFSEQPQRHMFGSYKLFKVKKVQFTQSVCWFEASRCGTPNAESRMVSRFPGGVLPYITYTFQRRFLERGLKNCGSRLYLLPGSCFCLKLLLIMKKHLFDVSRTNKEISFYKTGLFQFTNFLERSIKNWPISRTGYQF